MSSKKYRKKLKEQYTKPKKFHFLDKDHHAEEDREKILNFLRENPNQYFTSVELIAYALLYYETSSTVSQNIRYIRENLDANIVSKRGKGYMYVR